MKINLDYYNGKDEYSDGDIENVIIDYINKYSDDYEKAFEENSSWPVIYHLSNIRKNVVNWYPFEKDSTILEVGAGMGAITSELCDKCKKVTSIELSKRRASAIELRNQNRDNLELIIGNFKDIKLSEKYDYILLNGVLEYGSLYMDSNNPYIDFINKLKLNLKPTGKILVAIENKYGLKYWCGANEDHTGKIFDGIKGYPNYLNIRTFGKNELENLAEKCNMKTKFYYMFPDYKFPEIIMSDKSIENNVFCDYIPYYSDKMDLIFNEKKLFKNIFDEKMISFFSNSYFIEFSNNDEFSEIEFVKFNNYRKNEYNLFTYLKDNKFYKKNRYNDCEKHLTNIKEIYKLLKEKKVNIADTKYDGNNLYSEKISGQSLYDYFDDCYRENKIAEMITMYDKLYDYLLKICGSDVGCIGNNIFKKYNVKISKSKLEKLNFYEHGFLDIIPSNIFIKDKEFLLIDQEWYEENVPIEFIIFRAIKNFFAYFDDSGEISKKIYEHFNISRFEKEFNELDEKYINTIKNSNYKFYCQYYTNYNLLNFKDKISELENTNKELLENNSSLKLKNKYLESETCNLQEKLQKIYNSKGYKILNKIYKFKYYFKKR